MSEGKPITLRLVLVEDHILVRQSIRAFLVGAGLDVVGEAATGIEAVRLVDELQPDVVLLDIHLPEMSGIAAARHMLQRAPRTRIIALTAYGDGVYQRALSEVGAKAFILKTAELAELVRAIRQVVADDASSAAPSPSERANPPLLTEREVEVIACAARGWTNKHIGQHLAISDRTVQVHLQAIYQKLGVSNRTEAVLRAVTLGIVRSSDGAIS